MAFVFTSNCKLISKFLNNFRRPCWFNRETGEYFFISQDDADSLRKTLADVDSLQAALMHLKLEATSAEKSVAAFAHFTPEVTCWNSEAFWRYCRRCTRYTCGYEFLDIKWYLHQLFDDADFDRLFQLNFMALGHWIRSHLGTKIREPPAQVEVLLLAIVD